MTRFDRKAEEAWLLRRETRRRDPPFAPIAATSSDPDERERTRVYDALAAELEALPVWRAPSGWCDRLEAALDTIGAPGSPPRRWRRYAMVIGPLVAAAAVLLYAVAHRSAPGELSDVAISSDRAGSAPRTAVSALGDVLHVQARLPPGGELRLYRDDTLVVRCPGHAACGATSSEASTQVSIRLTLDTVGAYRALAISVADTPVTGSLDGDAREAGARGADFRPSPTLEVQ